LECALAQGHDLHPLVAENVGFTTHIFNSAKALKSTLLQ
jgi:hypothetical protein